MSINIKPLEWNELHTRRNECDPSTEVTGYEAETAFGTFYTIELGSALFHVVYDYQGFGEFETERHAKAAAQADYERRILSALSDAPVVTEEEKQEPRPSKFKVGDEVTRINGGEWFGMREGDKAVVAEVRPTPNNWHQLRLEGYGGLYSDFNFKLTAALGGE